MKYEEYLAEREKLVEENANLVGNVLNANEEKLEEKIRAMRAELKNSMEELKLNKMPVLRFENLWNSSFYRMLVRMPKGSDLHVHATALLPAWKLIDFVLSRNELAVDIRNGHIYNEKENFEKEFCFPLKESFEKGLITREELLRMWSLLGLRHGENVWAYFEKLLEYYESIEVDPETMRAYYVYAFKDYLKCGVFHIEIHALLSEVYEEAYEKAGTIRDAYYEVKKEFPELQVSIICAGLKYEGVEPEVPKRYLDNALRLKDALLDESDPAHVCPFIIGFDLLNEEDKSVPLKDLAPMLLDCAEKDPDFKLYLHCGESLNAQSNNLIDGYLLGAARVGHGMNLCRYPKLLQKYAEKEICLETCLISNQSLKYVKDLRLHPAFEYLRRGVVIALCSDDPVCQEHEQLTDDFFAAIVCWDLTVADIKQLCINSILYSGLVPYRKSLLMKDWKSAWDAFVKEVVNG